jgi:hypothetical protein
MIVRLTCPLAVCLALVSWAPAGARAYTCNVPRAMLCEGCAHDIVITLTAAGGCRVSFTPADGASPSGRVLPLRFEVIAPLARTLRPRLARPISVTPAATRCFSFNGNNYCE